MRTTARKTTSSEVKARWIEKAYKRYMVNLRYDTDQALIDWIEAQQKPTTEIFREVLKDHINNGAS